MRQKWQLAAGDVGARDDAVAGLEATPFAVEDLAAGGDDLADILVTADQGIVEVAFVRRCRHIACDSPRKVCLSVPQIPE